MLMLWQSGLDYDGMKALLSTLVLMPEVPALRMPAAGELLGDDEILVARLMGDKALERRVRYGLAIVDGRARSVGYTSRDWADLTSAALIPLIAGAELKEYQIIPPPADVDARDLHFIATLIFSYLKTVGAVDLPATARITRLLFALPRVFDMDEYALARAVIANPGLPNEVPQLRNPEVYGEYYRLVELCSHGRRGSRPPEKADYDHLLRIMEDVIKRQSVARRWAFKSLLREGDQASSAGRRLPPGTAVFGVSGRRTSR